jgi:CO/xanthine dehydrogenase Mo-binding subunit
MSRLLCLTELLRLANAARVPDLPPRLHRPGTRVLRAEDPRFLTTGGVYIDDLRLPGACHVHFVRSTVAHARIRSVDVAAALAEPGVIAAFTGADLDLPELAPPMAGTINAQMSQPLLALDAVRFVGGSGRPCGRPPQRRGAFLNQQRRT